MNGVVPIGMVIAMAIMVAPAAMPAQISTPLATPAAAKAQPDRSVTAAPSLPSPQECLDSATQGLDAVPVTVLSRDGQKKLGHLRDDVRNLVTAYQQRSLTVPRSARVDLSDHADHSRNAVINWRLTFDDVERDLASILGGGSSLNVTSTTAVSAPASMGSPTTQQ